MYLPRGRGFVKGDRSRLCGKNWRAEAELIEVVEMRVERKRREVPRWRRILVSAGWIAVVESRWLIRRQSGFMFG